MIKLLKRYRSLENQRTKRYLFGASASVVSQFISSIVSLSITGVLARYFTSEEFGIWSIVSTLLGLIIGLDLGFGNSLKNRLSYYYSIGGKESNEEARINFYSIFYIFFLGMFVLGIFVLIFRNRLPWSYILNAKDTNFYLESINILSTAIIFFSINAALQIYNYGFYAYQESQYISYLNILNKIIFSCYIIVALHYKINFLYINYSYFIITVFSSFIGLIVFIKKRNWYNYYLNFKNIKDVIKSLFGNSMQFTILQLMSVFISNVDLFIISKNLGLSAVGDYTLVKRVYLLIMSFHVILLFPLWPAFTEAMHKNDKAWIKNLLTKITSSTIIIFVFIISFLYVFGTALVKLWSGKYFESSYIFLLLGIYFFLVAINNCYSIFLNSINKLKWQITFGLICTVLIIPFSSIMLKNFGIPGMVVALITLILPGLIYSIMHTVIILKQI